MGDQADVLANPAQADEEEISGIERVLPPFAGSPLQTQELRGRRHVLVRRFRMRVTGGRDQGVMGTSTADKMVVGTHPSADLVLTDRTLSRFHCEVTVAEGRAFVRDLGSRNGTLVDGVSILHAPLRNGSVLTLGQTRVRFELASDHVKVPISGRGRFGLMVGESRAMRGVFSLAERASTSEMTVLLQGDTGTGKDVAAESIHQESARREGPFVVVDCGAIAANLIESELFGHEQGAFTGADRLRIGAFEAANGGTLFLDEIGELSRELQPKLLRVLEERQVQRIGSHRPLAVDVRVIAATNRNLRREVNEGRFRPDLFFRLAVLEIPLPPLRERLEDLPALVEEFLSRADAARQGGADRLRSVEFLERLARHSWPGNVRELRNYLERCLVMEAELPFINEAPQNDLPRIDPEQPLRTARERWVRYFERRYLEAVLVANHGNVSAAARAARVDRVHFYRLLDRTKLRERGSGGKTGDRS